MRFHLVGAALAASFVLSACSGERTASLDTDDQRASYALGLEVGTQFAPTEGLLDVDAFVRGFEDALTEAESAIDPVEAQGLLQAFTQRVREAQRRKRIAPREKPTSPRTRSGKGSPRRRPDCSTRSCRKGTAPGPPQAIG